LIDWCLQPDPRLRPTAVEVLHHEFLQPYQFANTTKAQIGEIQTALNDAKGIQPMS
jgi:serine/threonine protein kinase